MSVSGIESRIDELAKEIEDELTAYKKGMKMQIFRALTVLEVEIIANLRGRSGLHRRTGALMNSVSRSKRVFEDARGLLWGEIGPEGVPYAGIHEDGGVVNAKPGHSLTIPSEKNRRADGLPKITMQDLFGGKLGKNWFIHKGTVFAVTGVKKSGKYKGFENLTPLFYLRKQVTIPARPYLSTAMVIAGPKIMAEFGLFLSATFKPIS